MNTIKQTKHLSGKVIIPGSKSYTHRVLAAASLGTETLIVNPSHSDANIAMKNACESLGAKITGDLDWHVTGFQTPQSAKINMGNSGTALRFVISLASLTEHGITTLDGDDSLRRRPNKLLVDALGNLGANISGVSTKQYAPLTIHGKGLGGGKTLIPGDTSSQYISSLLLASPRAKSDVEISVTGDIVSQPYIEMTLDILKKFGIIIHNDNYRHYHIESNQKYASPTQCIIPGDYSQAAFFLAAACLIDSDVIISGLDKKDKQGDKKIVDLLKNMGAVIDDTADDYIRINGPFELEGIEADLIDAPDLFPVMAVLGIYAKGNTRLYNMPQIRLKETDRLAVIEREFEKIGVCVDVSDDEMTIHHTDLECKNFVFDASGDHGITDHRIAMALSLIGLRNGSSSILNAEKISVSYPNYFEDMRSIGVNCTHLELQGP